MSIYYRVALEVLISIVMHISSDYKGFTSLAENVKTFLSDDTVEVLFKLYLLLYADDTVIFVESREDLQLALNSMQGILWKIEINC